MDAIIGFISPVVNKAALTQKVWRDTSSVGYNDICSMVYTKLMATYAAFLRGVNVGGRNVLSMKDFITLLEKQGCRQVRTYIQSGNLVFQKDLTDRRMFVQEVVAEVSKDYGFSPHIILLDFAQMTSAIGNNPFSTKDGPRLHLFFLNSVPQHPNLDRISELQSRSEKFALHDEVFYLYAPNGIGKSRLAVKVEECLQVRATARNWNTVSKVMKMMSESVAVQD